MCCRAWASERGIASSPFSPDPKILRVHRVLRVGNGVDLVDGVAPCDGDWLERFWLGCARLCK
jgi:hypothetical protein